MIPVIISGGYGSRLWPVSRVTEPKPFLRLDSGLSLLQNTFNRASAIDNVENIITVTNEKLHFRIQDEYQQVNYNNVDCNFILEPYGRNTAPAIASACLFALKEYGPNEILLILPADHLITDTMNFKSIVDKASKIAAENLIVTFGIKPEYPETGYGYIELDRNLPIKDGFSIARFVEKPDLITAQNYISTEKYFWNSGMFCGRVSTFLKEFELYAGSILESINNCIKQSEIGKIRNSNILYLNENKFRNVENISIDYAIFEKSKNTAVLPCSLNWSDIGSWLSIYKNLATDKNNNAIIGESILHKVKDCLIYSTNRIVAGVDIDNLVIVDTPDAVLIANKNTSQEVKHIFERLQAMEHKTSQLHQKCYRPWGSYTVLEEGATHKIKRIEVKPGSSLSLQMHNHRSEHWIVVEGRATVNNGENTFELCPNQSTYIEIKAKHRLENKSSENLVLIEIQCGQYLGEDDIIRFEDKYGRV